MRFLAISLLLTAGVLGNVAKFDKNLAFRSPFFDEPQVGRFGVAKSV